MQNDLKKGYNKKLRPLKSVTLKKFRLQKKNRFWRVFKRFFLYKKRIKFFIQLKWLFNNRRIFKHQFLYLYGFSIRKVSFNNKLVYGFNASFLNFLISIERKIIVLLLRSKLCLKLLDCLGSIVKKHIAVNGSIVLKTLTALSCKDLLQKKMVVWSFYSRHRTYRWRRYRWKTVRYKLKRQGSKFFQRYLAFYRFAKSSVCINYLSVNYKISSCILVKYPLYSEIILGGNPIIVRKRYYRQLYFIY